jgi:hypothetical protein
LTHLLGIKTDLVQGGRFLRWAGETKNPKRRKRVAGQNPERRDLAKKRKPNRL